MKKFLFSILLAISLVGSGLAFAYNDGGAVNNKEMSNGSPADPVRNYVLVRWPEVTTGDSQLATGNALSAGDVVVWDCLSDDGVTVNISSVISSADAVAGFVVATITQDTVAAVSAVADIGHRNWGFVQNYGPILAGAKTSGTLTAGQAIAPGSGNLARYAVPAQGTVTQTNTRVIFGFAYDAESGTNTAADVFVRNR